MTDPGKSSSDTDHPDYDHEVVVDSVDEVTPVPIECPGCGGRFREKLTDKLSGTTCHECNDWIRYVRRHEIRDRGDSTEDTTEQATLIPDGGQLASDIELSDSGVAAPGGLVCQNFDVHDEEVKMVSGPYDGVQCPECGRMAGGGPPLDIPYVDEPGTPAAQSNTDTDRSEGSR